MLIQLNPIFKKAPGTINDLGTAFGLELATSLWVLMGGNLHISRHFPHPFAFDLDTLFAVPHLVVENATHFQLVRLGGVRVEDDSAILEVLSG